MNEKEKEQLRQKAMAEKYGQALDTGLAIPVGRTVLCDACNGDWTDRPESGGMVFESKAICPSCMPQWVASAMKYNEGHAIRARCPQGMSFADFIRAYRGPNAAITVTAPKLPK